MTKKKQIEAMASLEGLELHKSELGHLEFYDFKSKPSCRVDNRDYLNDHNVIQYVINSLSEDNFDRYVYLLGQIVGACGLLDYCMFRGYLKASTMQKVEAILKATGKWVEDKD